MNVVFEPMATNWLCGGVRIVGAMFVAMAALRKFRMSRHVLIAPRRARDRFERKTQIAPCARRPRSHRIESPPRRRCRRNNSSPPPRLRRTRPSTSGVCTQINAEVDPSSTVSAGTRGENSAGQRTFPCSCAELSLAIAAWQIDCEENVRSAAVGPGRAVEVPGDFRAGDKQAAASPRGTR